MSRFVYAARVATAWLSLCGLANAAVEVGWVEAVSNQSGASVILRGPERLAIERFQMLQVGDALSATEDARIDIRLGEDRKVITVTTANSPYLIQRAGEVPGVYSRMLGWLREVALRKVGQKDSHGDRVAIAATRKANLRAKPLSFDVFPNPEYFLLAGQRNLHFVWRGGVPPFSARLTHQQTSDLIGQQASISARETTLTSAALEPGNYILSVADASGASRLMRISVLERNAAPQLTVGGGASLTASQRALANAMTLASAPNNAWLFEAYQQVVALDFPEAAFLRSAIEQGDALPTFNPND